MPAGGHGELGLRPAAGGPSTAEAAAAVAGVQCGRRTLAYLLHCWKRAAVQGDPSERMVKGPQGSTSLPNLERKSLSAFVLHKTLASVYALISICVSLNWILGV